MYGSAVTGAVAVIAANVCLRPIGKALNRGAGPADVDITYLFRITARTDQKAHLRALLLHALGGAAAAPQVPTERRRRAHGQGRSEGHLDEHRQAELASRTNCQPFESGARRQRSQLGNRG